MFQQRCPECGCLIGEDAFEKEGVVYCCEPCAMGEECECSGCAEEEDAEKITG
jgi:hypothetical protein